jgi:Polyketide cyclase / dehydrase and lipid transport
MADYRFETTWRLTANQADAWALLVDGEGWPRWWPSVRQVEQLSPGSDGGVGRRLRYHFATRLPYTLTFEAQLVEVTEPTRLVAEASGELVGTWTCDLEQQNGETVVVRHVWAVATTRAWMNALSPLARPLFAWNHTSLMREGGDGFAAQLGTTASVESPPPSRRVGPVIASGVGAVVLGMVVVAAWRRLRCGTSALNTQRRVAGYCHCVNSGHRVRRP